MTKSRDNLNITPTDIMQLRIMGLVVFFCIIHLSYSQKTGLNPHEKIANLEHNYWDEISSIPIQRVFDIEQDTSGYIWLGTDRGLLRFDGTEAKAYTFKDHELLKIDNINYVEIISDNEIWLANKRGVYYLKNDLIEEIKFNNKPITRISNMQLDSNQKLWITTFENKLLSIENFVVKQEKINSERIYKVFEGYNNAIWVTTGTNNEMKIWKLKPDNTFEMRKLDKIISGSINRFSEDKSGLIVCGTINDGFIYKIKDENVTKVHITKGNRDFRTSITFDNYGAIWMSGNGLERMFNQRIDRFQEIDGLSNDNIRSLFFDRDQNLWIGTNRGLSFISKSPFRSLKLQDEKDIKIRCVLEGDYGEILVGSDENGLLIKHENHLEELTGLNALGKRIKTLSKTNRQGEYIVGSTKGLFKIRTKDGNFSVIDQFSSNNIGIAYCRYNGEIWFTEAQKETEKDIYETGLTYVLKDGLKHQIDSLNEINVYSMVEQKNENFWIGTARGLFNYNTKNQEFVLQRTESLGQKYIQNIEYGFDGSIWAGTYGSGLLNIDKHGGEKLYTSRNGLPVNQASFHLGSKEQSLWYLVPYKGLGKLQKLFYSHKDTTYSIHQGKTYSLSNSIGSSGMSGFPRSIMREDGSYLIVSNESLLEFNPNAIIDPRPLLKLEKILLNRNEIALDNSIEFEAESFNFEFHYSSLDFIRGGLQQFEYKLEGFDSNWQKAGNRRIAYYSILPAGDYRFRARVLSDNGEFIEMSSPVLFSKKEYWWKTKKAYFFYIIFLVTIVVTVYRLRVGSLKRQRKKLRTEVAERTSQLKDLNANLEQKVQDRTQDILKVNKTLVQSEERYKYALEATNDGIWDWDVQNDVIKYSPSIYTMLGYKPYEFEETRAAIYNCIAGEDRKDWHISKHEIIIKEAHDTQIIDEYRMKKKNGEIIWVLLKAKIVERNKDGTPKRIVGTHTDITNDKRKAQELLEAVLKTENIERSRISRDIHDGLQQTLTISSMNLQSIKKELNNLSKQAVKKFEVGWKYLQDSITESRAVAHTLMPKAIIDFGVILAFDSLIKEMDNSSEQIRFNFHHNFDKEKLDNQQIEITLYRILQEGLNNIIKYAKASNVTIQLKDYADMYMLTIEDDGVGFDKEKVNENNTGLGFQSMQNRLEAINGFLEVDSRVGHGTTILVEISKTL